MSQQAFSLLQPGVQEAIWRMGWKDFKPIQVRSIHAVCETANHLVICAQTAGGKTEAAFLPIISRLAAEPQPSVQALYVGPLKALINDQFRRLEELCATLEIPVHRWHGDVPANQKKALRDNPGGILLITPESLESNFINFGVQVPRVYRHLSFVVIDELHSFLSNVRGVHLQSLLSRLSAATGCSPRLVGLSATLADPQAARAFLAPDAADSVQVIEDTSAKREIKFGIKAFLKRPQEGKETAPRLTPEQALALANNLTAPTAPDEKALEASIGEHTAPESSKPERSGEDELDEIADDVIKNFQLSTNLIFGNSKQSIEVLADRLHQRVRHEKWPADPFVVHHGSLSKDLREDAEAILKSGVPTTALCSSTLEMGIDIGHVRAVGQVDTPWSVSSMVQRLGRSGRRAGEAAVMRMYVREESPHGRSTLTDLLYPDLLRAIAMTRLMLAKWLEPFDQNRMNLSTLVHQVLSCLKQTGGMRAADLFHALCQRGPFRNVTQPQFAVLLRGLGGHDLIEQTPQGELILGLAGERITAAFDFYAAFETTEEFVIRCGSEEIGKLAADIIPPVGEHLLLAGKRWCVEEILPAQKLAFVTLAPGGKAPPFRGGTGDIHTRVVGEMKAVLSGEEEPAYLDENAKLLLRAARRTARAVGLADRDIIVGRQSVQWFPWAGTRTLLTLGLLAKAAKVVCEVDRLSITYQLPSAEAFHVHLRQVVSSASDALALARLMPVRAVEKFDDYVPEDLLDEANARSRLNVTEAREACAAAPR
ncbi:MAG: DEAD/DEAH box helicase [Verrucomicrobia bacterium]|nr:DEAD/DEAH box helicase [Verrucomicrobiota bacterium]